jgi:hypothetical protein
MLRTTNEYIDKCLEEWHRAQRKENYEILERYEFEAWLDSELKIFQEWEEHAELVYAINTLQAKRAKMQEEKEEELPELMAWSKEQGELLPFYMLLEDKEQEQKDFQHWLNQKYTCQKQNKPAPSIPHAPTLFQPLSKNKLKRLGAASFNQQENLFKPRKVPKEQVHHVQYSSMGKSRGHR